MNSEEVRLECSPKISERSLMQRLIVRILLWSDSTWAKFKFELLLMTNKPVLVNLYMCVY